MNRVLFIDDEEFVLKVLKRKLEKCMFKSYFAQTAKEGLELLKQTDFDVVVTDIQMPDMDGIELSQAIQKVSPRTVRIILSGTKRVEAIIEAINIGHVYQYISKPWIIDDKGIKIIEETIKVSKSYEYKNDLKHQLGLVELSKLPGHSRWIITDLENKILFRKSDYPIIEKLESLNFKILKSTLGDLKLFEFGG